MAVIARASITIADLNDPIQQGVAPSNPVEGTLWLDTSKSPPAMYRWSGGEWERVNEIEIGGVNLIGNSASHTLIGDDTDTTSAITGALMGAVCGLDAIDEQWQRNVHGWPRRDGQASTVDDLIAAAYAAVRHRG